MTTYHRTSWMKSQRQRHWSPSRLTLSWSDCENYEVIQTAVSRLQKPMQLISKAKRTGMRSSFDVQLTNVVLVSVPHQYQNIPHFPKIYKVRLKWSDFVHRCDCCFRFQLVVSFYLFLSSSKLVWCYTCPSCRRFLLPLLTFRPFWISYAFWFFSSFNNINF